MIEEEIWKDIPEFEGVYKISNTGKILSLPRCNSKTPYYKCKNNSRILKPFLSGEYPSVQLCTVLKRKKIAVHILLGQIFIPNPENKTEINHKDGNKLNYQLSNLEWNTPKENNLHAWETGLNNHHGENNELSKLKFNTVLEIIKWKDKGESQKKVAEIFNINQSTVCRIWNSKRWKYSLNKIKKSA